MNKEIISIHAEVIHHYVQPLQTFDIQFLLPDRLYTNIQQSSSWVFFLDLEPHSSPASNLKFLNDTAS